MLRNLYTNNIYSGLHLSCVNVMYFTYLENILCATYLNAAYGLQENEESKNSIYHVKMLRTPSFKSTSSVLHNSSIKYVEPISWELTLWTWSILRKCCWSYLSSIYVVDSISHEGKILWSQSLINKCLFFNLSLGKCCVLHHLRVNAVDSMSYKIMWCFRSVRSKYCVLDFSWTYVVDSVSHE